MIVDDEASVRDGIEYAMPWNQLEIENVYKAASGYEALEILNQHTIDIVVTDIRMPGMSGLELIQTINKRWKGIKCIILSGHAEFQYAQEAIRSQTTDYLLKPVLTQDFIQTVQNVQQKLKEEWEQVSSYKQTMAALYEHRPLLRSNLLNDLFCGRFMAHKQLQDKMKFLEIPFFEGDEFALMVIRLEDEFPDYDISNQYLLEYAVCNITEEIFGQHFKLWSSRDSHDFLVFAIRVDEETVNELTLKENQIENIRQQLIERLADQLQKSVQTYLKGRISLMISNWGRFPDEIRQLYELSISTMRRRIGSDKNFFFTMGDETEASKMYSLDQLYRTPTLMNLLEAGCWDNAREKLQCIFDEISEKFSDSLEHIVEASQVINATFSHMAHQNGRSLMGLISNDLQSALKGENFRSLAQLQNWSFRVLDILEEDMAFNTSNMRKSILVKAQEYIEEHLAEDVSLTTIAEFVHLHPVYFSKVFKLETGKNFSEYLNGVKMNKAAYLLKHSELKIYEVAKMVGYENTYFMKVFKKHFSITPQEYRES